MLNLFEKYRHIIKTYRVSSYDQEGDSCRIKIEITFINYSRLLVKEYFFENMERKYAFHWADEEGRLLCRWDNARHWNEVSTFPHHKHVGTKVLESRETTLEEVLFVIDKDVSKK